jgi:Fibronectin type III domain
MRSATSHPSIRALRATVVAAVSVASVAVLGTNVAHAAPTGTLIACGDISSDAAVSIGHGCTSLSDALTAALSVQFSETIYLMPGQYCPLDVPVNPALGYPPNDLTLIGVGAAGLDPADNGVFTGPEAALSTFTYDSGTCGVAPADELNWPTDEVHEDGNLTLENLAVDGSAAGSPAIGINVYDAGLSMSDVLATNFSNAGLAFGASGFFISQQIAQMGVANSAFVDDGTGVSFNAFSTVRAMGSIDDSTIAGNSTTGIANNGSLNLQSDTISHNGVGIDVTTTTEGQTFSTIIGGNTTDCEGSVEPSGQFSGSNLMPASCQDGNAASGDPDITLTDAVAAVALVPGAPTPSITPPPQAVGQALGNCGSLTNTDQIEDLITAGVACDIGSIATTHVTTAPSVQSDTASLAFSTVPTNFPASAVVHIGNAGAGLQGVSSVSITQTGSAFSITDDGCTYILLTHGEGNGECGIDVQAAPSAIGENDTGTLTVDTTDGDFDIPLSATGGAAATNPDPPTNLKGTAGSGQVALTWDAPTNTGNEPVGSYQVELSTDNGADWQNADFPSGTSDTIAFLTNGQAYLFRVLAVTNFGSSVPSAVLGPIKPVGAAHLSGLTAPKSLTIKEGASATLTTTLTDITNGTPISGATVFLDAGATTKASGPITTNAQGVASAIVKPTKNTHYRWSFAGTTGHHAAHSANDQVTVEQVVHASLTHKKVRHNRTVEIYGTVSPNATNKVVFVQRLVHGKWTNLPHDAVISLQRLPHHRKVVGFVYLYSPAKKGTETLRVTRAGTSTNAAGVSRRLTLKVT